jgi:hypothetical protein
MPRDFSPKSEQPVLIFRNGLGDYLLAVAAVRALSTIFEGRLTVVCPGGVAMTFFSDVAFHRVVETSFDRGSFDVSRVVSAVQGCDLLLSLNPWESPSLRQLCSELKPAASVGLVGEFDSVLGVNTNVHAVEQSFELARYCDPCCRLGDFDRPLRYEDEAKRFAEDVRSVLGSRRLLICHADTHQEKMWDAQKFRSAVKRFLHVRDDFTAVIVGTRDVGVLDPADDRIVSALGLPLKCSLALMSVADLFLGVDSCMLHAADLARVPSVGLFGPTLAKEFGLFFSDGMCIQARDDLALVHDDLVAECVLEVAEGASRGGW